MIRAHVIPNKVVAGKASRGIPAVLVFKSTTLFKMLLGNNAKSLGLHFTRKRPIFKTISMQKGLQPATNYQKRRTIKAIAAGWPPAKQHPTTANQ